MVPNRNRLLFLLVLISAIAALSWSSALAHGARYPIASGPTYVSAGHQRLGPTSGEPDVGQGPKRTGGIRAPVLEPPLGSPVDVWLHWIVRNWMMRWLGAR